MKIKKYEINFEEIDKKLNKYKETKLNEHLLKQLREDLIIKWTYNSNAIEGSTFTLMETKVLLEDGITVGGKTMREHLEIIGHAEAIYYLEEITKDDTELSEKEIRNIHSLITKGIEKYKSRTVSNSPSLYKRCRAYSTTALHDTSWNGKINVMV